MLDYRYYEKDNICEVKVTEELSFTKKSYKKTEGLWRGGAGLTTNMKMNAMK